MGLSCASRWTHSKAGAPPASACSIHPRAASEEGRPAIGLPGGTQLYGSLAEQRLAVTTAMEDRALREARKRRLLLQEPLAPLSQRIVVPARSAPVSHGGVARLRAAERDAGALRVPGGITGSGP